ncbi:MAG: hypothetical protein P4L39_10680 [Humidesulfovibrio sp.]|nr:hypothetical protein [Humidesulfovibrio sp.]
MAQPADKDTLTLAGLAAANGPWLSVRLLRLAELAGRPLASEVVENAVAGASKVLGEILNSEGHPALNMDAASDPVAQWGREQAEAHQGAGLFMPASLKVQRLLRRAYDDLVRESWVERDSRARAHEDVERFFERALVGLVSVWTGQSTADQRAQADKSLAELVARREDELRRTLDAAKKITQLMHQARERAEATARELELVRARSQAEKQALAAQLRGLEEERAVLGGRLTDLETALTAHGDAEQELARVRAEADRERDRAEAARAELRALQEKIQDLRRQEELQTRGVQAEAEAEALRTELRALREAHASLASEAEAMRARLSEAGSRASEVRRSEEEESQTRLAQAAEALAQAQARVAGLEERLGRTGEALVASQTAGKDAEARALRLAEDLSRTQVELLNIRAELSESLAQCAAAPASPLPWSPD